MVYKYNIIFENYADADYLKNLLMDAMSRKAPVVSCREIHDLTLLSGLFTGMVYASDGFSKTPDAFWTAKQIDNLLMSSMQVGETWATVLVFETPFSGQNEEVG